MGFIFLLLVASHECHPDDDQPRQEADLVLQHAGQGGDRDARQAGQGESVKVKDRLESLDNISPHDLSIFVNLIPI